MADHAYNQNEATYQPKKAGASARGRELVKDFPNPNSVAYRSKKDAAGTKTVHGRPLGIKKTSSK